MLFVVLRRIRSFAVRTATLTAIRATRSTHFSYFGARRTNRDRCVDSTTAYGIGLEIDGTVAAGRTDTAKTDDEMPDVQFEKKKRNRNIYINMYGRTCNVLATISVINT